jgi:hypothetical protein
LQPQSSIGELKKKENPMKLSSRIMLASLICVLIVPFAVARRAEPAVSVSGVYENFTVGRGSGDLEGMRVVILPAGGGHYAIVQIAQGGAEDPKPEFVPVTVNGMKVEFTVGDQKFTGLADAILLRLKDPEGQTHVLRRKPCSSLFR